MATRVKKKKEKKLLRLNIGTQDIETYNKAFFDYRKAPWPLDSESVEEIYLPMILNYTPGDARGRLMDEVWRVLVMGGKAHITAPYWSSMRSIQDYAAEWPPICEASFQYFNAAWRKLNHPDRTLKCNFDFGFAYQVPNETAARNEETRAFYLKHYNNTISDLTVTLTKLPSIP